MTYPKVSDKPCSNCYNHFTIKRKRDENQKFCGRKCASIFLKSNKETKNCLTCNKKFETIPSRDYHYCSKKCANQSRSKIHIRVCEHCGMKFELDNIAYEKRGGGKFCSRECATRIYDFDESYFQDINTPEKAYWLGFLFADGNIYKNQMTLKLQRRDEKHLIKFKEALLSEHPIHRGKNDTHKNSYYSSLLIGSKKLCAQLIKTGMIPKKSLIVKYPQIAKELEMHFIRGYFDGDGCIYVNRKKNNHKTWSIYSGSKTFIIELQKILEKNLGIDIKMNKQKKGFRVYGSNKLSVQSVFDYMYQNATIYLERKREKFLL